MLTRRRRIVEAMNAHDFCVRDRVAPCGRKPAGNLSPGRERERKHADPRRGIAVGTGFSLGEAPRHVMDEKYCPARLPGGGTSRLFAEAMARVGYILYPTRALPPSSHHKRDGWCIGLVGVGAQSGCALFPSDRASGAAGLRPSKMSYAERGPMETSGSSHMHA